MTMGMELEQLMVVQTVDQTVAWMVQQKVAQMVFQMAQKKVAWKDEKTVEKKVAWMVQKKVDRSDYLWVVLLVVLKAQLLVLMMGYWKGSSLVDYLEPKLELKMVTSREQPKVRTKEQLWGCL